MTSWNWIFIFSWLDVISALIKLFKSSFFIQSEDHLKIWIFYCCKKWPTNQHQHWSGWWWFAWENFRYWCLAELSLLILCQARGPVTAEIWSPWVLTIVWYHHQFSSPQSNQLLNSNSASLQILSQILKYEMGREQFLENDKLSVVGLEN